MTIHANAERLDALQQLKGVGRREAGTEVAQALGAGPHDEGGGAELLVEDNAVIAGIGLGQHPEICRTRASRTGRRRQSTPPMAIPWPPIHLVVEFITMSAPSSIGRLR